MKFKVGDNVKIIGSPEEYHEPLQEKFIGMFTRITRVDEDDEYPYVVNIKDGNDWLRVNEYEIVYGLGKIDKIKKKLVGGD